VAPQAMRVEKVGYNERSGRFVVANVMRPDGSFDDSDGYRLAFAHLSEVLVEEDDVLQRGQSFGRSGATGRVTGPHLHFRVQWVEDGFLSDDVISVDPLAVIPEEVFAGQMQPFSLGTRSTTALQKGQPINIIIAPGAGRVSAGGRGITQPDVGIQIPLPGLKNDVEQSAFYAANDNDEGDPLAGIVYDLVEEAPNFIRTVAQVAQAAGNIASVGGTLASFIPGAAPVAIPVAAVGSAVSASAQPIAQVGSRVAQVGGNIVKGDDPLEGII
ncbi:MAG: M23 family metallopeptidase, partial [Deltaproteobacteria bacterium]|nr:M23 family metallopeptidase [Deltaproteobacteria bacterium]